MLIEMKSPRGRKGDAAPFWFGDRLTDFVEVDHDPETGETWYACWLEY